MYENANTYACDPTAMQKAARGKVQLWMGIHDGSMLHMFQKSRPLPTPPNTVTTHAKPT